MELLQSKPTDFIGKHSYMRALLVPKKKEFQRDGRGRGGIQGLQNAHCTRYQIKMSLMRSLFLFTLCLQNQAIVGQYVLSPAAGKAQ